MGNNQSNFDYRRLEDVILIFYSRQWFIS